MTQILVFEQTGQVATELHHLAPEELFIGRDWADLAACDTAIREIQPAAVDKAETEEPAATVVNDDTPAAMARECAALGIPFVHISTDYVFDGACTAPFAPDHTTVPLGAHRRSKLMDEEGVQAAGGGGTHAILHNSWALAVHGNSFLKTILRLGATRDKLTVVADQIGVLTPTPAREFADGLR